MWRYDVIGNYPGLTFKPFIRKFMEIYEFTKIERTSINAVIKSQEILMDKI